MQIALKLFKIARVTLLYIILLSVSLIAIAIRMFTVNIRKWWMDVKNIWKGVNHGRREETRS